MKTLCLLALLTSTFSTQASAWHLAAVGAEARAESYRPRAEVIVAVLDSGLDLTHPQLKGKIAVNALERDGVAGVDDDGNGVADDVYGYDFFANTPHMTDPLGHGTEVAGLIAASKAEGVEGLAPSFVKILPIRIVGAGGVFQLAPALAGIRYAIARGAKVINASWNVPSDHLELRALMNELAEEDILLVNSAGNEGELVEREPTYPTLYQLPNQLNVANLREELFLSFLSNFSRESVHLAAPGEKLLSLRTGGGVRPVSGTSFAAPLVSAAAAMLWAMHPTLSALEIKARILESATPLWQLEARLSSGATLHLGRLLQGLRASEDPSLPQNWSTTLEGLQSPHPYAANTRLFWAIDIPGAREVVLNFARLELSLGDALEVLDAHGVVLERFTGRYPGPVQSKSFPAPLSLRLVSDDSLEAHGFTLKNIAWR